MKGIARCCLALITVVLLCGCEPKGFLPPGTTITVPVSLK